MTLANHECNKQFCDNCKENKDISQLCYMRPLKDALPHASDKVIYLFMISKQPKLQSSRLRKSYTYLTSSAFSISVRDARMWRIACDAG